MSQLRFKVRIPRTEGRRTLIAKIVSLDLAHQERDERILPPEGAAA
jgi:hypothetical protein